MALNFSNQFNCGAVRVEPKPGTYDVVRFTVCCPSCNHQERKGIEQGYLDIGRDYSSTVRCENCRNDFQFSFLVNGSKEY